MKKKSTILLCAILVFFPFAYLFLLSLSTSWLFPNVLPTSINGSNWQSIFSGNNGLVNAIINSTSIALSVATVATIIGFIISKHIASIKQRNLFLIACYLPFVLSPVIYALMLNYFFIKINISGSLLGVIIAQLIITMPFAIILLNSFWSNTITALQEVSSTLGSNTFTIYTKILLPIAKPQLWVCFFQCFLISWFEYGLTSIIGIGTVQTLPLKVYQFISEANMYYAALAACIIILLPAILLWVNKRLIFSKIY